MRIKLLQCAAVVGVLMVTAAPAAAQDAGPVADGGKGVLVQASVTAGSLGIGPDIGLRFSDHIGIRGGASFFNISGTYESDDVNYDGKLKFNSFGGMVDIYPFGGAFRISGGARINNNRIDLAATPTDTSGTVEVGDESFATAQVGTISGKAKPNRFSPALTLGWAGSNTRGLFFSFEAGALFQGAYKLQDFRASGSLNSNARFQAALAREQATLQEDVDKLKVWPVLQAGIGFRF